MFLCCVLVTKNKRKHENAASTFTAHTLFSEPHFAPRASDLRTFHLRPQMSHPTHHNPHLTPDVHTSHLAYQTPFILVRQGIFIAQGGMVLMLPDSGMLQERLFVWVIAKHEFINLMFLIQHSYIMCAFYCRATLC